MIPTPWFLLAASLVATPSAAPAAAPPPIVIAVQLVAETPVVDGDLGDWTADGWSRITVRPAVDPAERTKLGLESQDRNHTGVLEVQVKAVMTRTRFFLAVRWPDDTPDVDFRPWEWRGDRYTESTKRDDMFAVRFHLDGDYDRSMLSGRNYRVDVWVWSAGRSNATGHADDMIHAIGARPQDDAAEYEVKGTGTVYIRKQRDAGTPGYRNVRPANRFQGDRLPSVERLARPSGSAADVAAKGLWASGRWAVEFARDLDTTHADDVVFRPGTRLVGQIAVFNRGHAEHKSVSEPLVFEFPPLR